MKICDENLDQEPMFKSKLSKKARLTKISTTMTHHRQFRQNMTYEVQMI